MKSDTPIQSETKRDHRLFAYALAAGAAGVAGQSAQAAIEYFDIDDIAIGQGGKQALYINGDAQTDIELKNYVFGLGNYQGVFIPYSGGRIMGTMPTGLSYATALSGGEEISPSTISNYFVGSLAYGATNPNAEFNSVTDAYIGFSFPADAGDDIFYAWVRVDIDNAAGSFIIKDFAFENVAHQGILAGATTGGATLTGDLDGDGFVGIDDLNIVLGNWNQNVPPANPLADPSGDNFVGIDDLNEVLGNWNAGTPAVPAAAVPEPGALSFLAAGAAGVSLWRRRRA